MAGWLEKITGSRDARRRFREYQARVAHLPESHRTAVEGIERYLTHVGLITDGDVLVAMLDDLADLFEQSAADGTPVRGIVGNDPVDFVEAFLRNYADGQSVNPERQRLLDTIERATGEES